MSKTGRLVKTQNGAKETRTKMSKDLSKKKKNEKNIVQEMSIDLRNVSGSEGARDQQRRRQVVRNDKDCSLIEAAELS